MVVAIQQQLRVVQCPGVGVIISLDCWVLRSRVGVIGRLAAAARAAMENFPVPNRCVAAVKAKGQLGGKNSTGRQKAYFSRKCCGREVKLPPLVRQ